MWSMYGDPVGSGLRDFGTDQAGVGLLNAGTLILGAQRLAFRSFWVASYSP